MKKTTPKHLLWAAIPASTSSLVMLGLSNSPVSHASAHHFVTLSSTILVLPADGALCCTRAMLNQLEEICAQHY